MLKRATSFLCIACGVLEVFWVAVVPEARAEVLFSNEGNWQIVISEEYHGCIARAQYRDGTRVTYGVDAITNSPFINFSNYQWKEFIPDQL